ncbi:nucleoside monophosphate kinase [Saltatorellus ferox]
MTVREFHPPIVVLLGRPGSGKGTQCNLLADRFRAAGRTCVVVQTGTILRDLASASLAISPFVTNVIASGTLMPPSIIASLWVASILRAAASTEPVILDGSPRTIAEVPLLEEVALVIDRVTDVRIIHLAISESAALERMMQRGRKDDASEAIRNRLALFNLHLPPILIRLQQGGRTPIVIDGERAPELVAADIWSSLS